MSSIHALPDRHNRILVQRLVVEAMNEDCTHGNVAHGGGSVHVWGGISHSFKNLVFSISEVRFDGYTLNADMAVCM